MLQGISFFLLEPPSRAARFVFRKSSDAYTLRQKVLLIFISALSKVQIFGLIA